MAKCARHAQVQQLHAEGYSLHAIAARTGLERKTVRKYVHLPVPPPPQTRGQRNSLLDPYKPYIRERWQAGCSNAMQLLGEIQHQGYPGQRSTLRAYLTQLRKAQGLAPRSRSDGTGTSMVPVDKPPTRRTLTWLIIRQPKTRKDDEQLAVDRARQAHPDVATAITLAQDFAAIVRGRNADKLDDWLDRATASGLVSLRNFAKSLRQDEAVIRAALTLAWSNGPVEGHINRLKLLKRQSYGRAKLDLLRIRLRAA
jgi:transposase